VTKGQFLPPLSSAFPSQINVDVTEYCNLACIHCPYITAMRPKGKDRHQLSVALHRKMVDEIAAFGLGHCRFIRYTGEGEPLMHPHLDEMLADAAVRTGLPINLTTNGMLLTEARSQALIDAGVTTFDVSIDALNSITYETIRVGGILSQVDENTRTLIRLCRPRGVNVIISFVRQPGNEAEAEQFKRYWEDQGATAVVLRRLHSCAGYFPEVAGRMWREAPPLRTPCLYPWERLVLKPDGALAYCPAAWLHEANIADLARESIAEAWTGEKMAALRQAHLSDDYTHHAFCSQCPDWSVINWPGEGPTYGTVMAGLSQRSAK